MHRLTLCVTMVALFVLGDCGPRFGGSNNVQNTFVPHPALYADAANVTKTVDGATRITVYTSKAPVNEVYHFHGASLRAQGWEKIAASTPGFDLYGIGGEHSPTPFELLIQVRPTKEGGSRVELRQWVSGPLAWPDE